jgi:hypothetical protein
LPYLAIIRLNSKKIWKIWKIISRNIRKKHSLHERFCVFRICNFKGKNVRNGLGITLNSEWVSKILFSIFCCCKLVE